MKKYLNRAEVENWAYFGTMLEICFDCLEHWSDNLTVDERRNLKTVITLGRKALDSVVKRLGYECAKKIKHYMDSNTCRMFPNETSNMYKRRIETEMAQEGIWCESDLFYTMADIALQHSCCPCKKSAEEQKQCPLRQAFYGMDIPVFDDSPADGVCPYDVGGGKPT